jgi:hypothetical protein
MPLQSKTDQRKPMPVLFSKTAGRVRDNGNPNKFSSIVKWVWKVGGSIQQKRLNINGKIPSTSINREVVCCPSHVHDPETNWRMHHRNDPSYAEWWKLWMISSSGWQTQEANPFLKRRYIKLKKNQLLKQNHTHEEQILWLESNVTITRLLFMLSKKKQLNKKKNSSRVIAVSYAVYVSSLPKCSIHRFHSMNDVLRWLEYKPVSAFPTQRKFDKSNSWPV